MPWQKAMFALLKYCGTRLAVICIAMAPLTGQASAISAEVARKCNALTAKAFPPRQVGNPASGPVGTGLAVRDYFNKCIANGGNMDNGQGPNGPK